MFDFSYSPLLSAILKNAERNPDKIALIEGERKISYKDLFSGILNTGVYLTSIGLTKGDCIIICAKKEIEFIYLYFGAHCVGVRNVIIDAAAKEERVKYIAEITNPKFIFGYELKDYENYSLTSISTALNNKGWIYQFPKINTHDIADIMFTTGTTGKPKGVCLSHANIAASATQINSFIKNTEDDIEVLALPMSHSFALGRVRCNLLVGGTLILLGSFANLKLFFESIEEYNCTGFAITSASWSYIKKVSGTKIAKFANQIRYIEIGSMPMSMSDKTELIDIFKNTRLCMHYGLTEASRSIFIELHERKNNMDSIGSPVTDTVNIKIMSDVGIELTDGETGEICINGSHVMERYYLDTDNANAFWGKYFRSGDLGYKKDGLFYLSGRKKEIINVGGNKVSPVTIEEAILKLGVDDCACVAVPDPNGMLGEVPKAFIVKGNCKLSFDEIKKQLKDILESFQIPQEYEWIDKIPRTESGKVQRLVLKGK